jgi:hypothetical protein
MAVRSRVWTPVLYSPVVGIAGVSHGHLALESKFEGHICVH